MSAQSSKQKRKFVSLETKILALKRLDSGESIKKLAGELGVGEVTVGDWRRNRSKLEQWYSTKASCSSSSKTSKCTDRKTMKTSDYERTSAALYLWFSQQRDKGSPISGPMIQEKALFFRKEFQEGESSFSASSGWLDRWKKRYGVRQLEICGEKLSADSEAVTVIQKQIKNIIKEEKLSLDQLYNCDETGLNYRMMPSKTLAARNEATVPGYKKSKDRITILACSNATGDHKLPLLLIGKSVKPRAFKNIQMSALPVLYKSQKSAWMDSLIFKNWFFNTFVPETKKYLTGKKLPLKAILMLDNAGCHPNAEELRSGDIYTIFLPPNTTSLVQPMDQGALECLKKLYRRKLLQSLLYSTENESQSVQTFQKKINMKDVVYWVAEAWGNVKSETLTKSWRKLLEKHENEKNETNENNNDTPPEENENEQLLDLVRQLPGCENADESEMQEWLNQDEQYELTDSAIMESVKEEIGDSSDEEEGDNAGVAKVTHSEGTAALELALRYVEQQNVATPADVMLIRRWRDYAAKNRNSSQKQKTIDSFFRK